MTLLHPTIVSDKMVSTVNFYEDYFGFVPVVEKDGFTLLCNPEKQAEQIEIFDSNHRCIKGVRPVQGLILNIPVEDVQKIYDLLYMEGLDLYKELGTDIHGRRHFVVYDPNGVLVNVHEAVDVPAFEPA